MVVLRAGLCPGLTEEMIQVLRANGVRTVVDFVSSDLEDVSQKCSLSYKALVAVRRVLLAQFSAFPANGADLYEELKSSTAILPTRSPSLDQLLDSGLYTGEVTELMGAPGSGKTQLEALQRIQVARVFDVYEMLSALQEVRDRLSQQAVSCTGPLKTVLIDSVSAVIHPLLGGRQSEGLAIMMQLARELKMLAKEFSLAVVVTNQVTRDSSTGLLKPALGRSWSFVPSTRVLLESKGAPWEEVTTRRSASLAKSPRQVRLLPGQHLCDGEVTRTWPQSRGRFLMGLGRFRPHGGTQCSGRGTHAARLHATEEKSTCSLQLELVFIGKLNERHCLQSRSPCSSCSSRSRDAAEPAWTPAEVTLA
uniref:RAD51 paralog D n=1 Tax=Cairina moschata TaxID=8855 RepID=A0A8C3CW53_CAIMO